MSAHMVHVVDRTEPTKILADTYRYLQILEISQKKNRAAPKYSRVFPSVAPALQTATFHSCSVGVHIDINENVLRFVGHGNSAAGLPALGIPCGRRAVKV